MALPLVLGGASAAQAGSPPATPPVGPATLTFPEIARALSRNGRKVRCDPSLRDSAAFLSLRSRPWEQARDVLERGLGVRLHDKGHGEWELEPDAALLRQERRWRERYVALAEERVQQHLDRLRRQYRALSYRQLSTELDTRVEEYGQKLAAEREAAIARGERWGWGCLEPIAIPSRITEVQSLLSPAGWQLLHTAPRRLQLAPLLEGGWGLSTDSPRRLAVSGWVGTDPQEVATWLETADVLMQATRFDPYTRLLRTQGWLVSPERVFEDHQSEPLILPCDEDSLSRTLRSLDRESETACHRDQAATEAAFAFPECRRPFTSRGSRLDPSVSQVVESWSRETHQEAIMVLWPGREASSGSWGTEFSLQDWYQQDAGARNVERQAAIAGVAGWEQLRRWNSEPASEHSPWAMERRAGVLLVRNRLAFLDRPRRFPLAAFLRLERAIPRSEGPVRVPAVPYSVLSAYVRDAVPEKNGEWTGLHRRQYRGVFVRSLARLQPLLHLTESLDPGGKAQLRRRLATGERLRIPLARFPLAARHRLLPALRALGPTYPLVWHPRAAERLALCELELWADLPEKGWAGADLYAALSDFSYGGRRDPATQRNGDSRVYWSHDWSRDGPGLSGVTFGEGR